MKQAVSCGKSIHASVAKGFRMKRRLTYCGKKTLTEQGRGGERVLVVLPAFYPPLPPLSPPRVTPTMRAAGDNFSRLWQANYCAVRASWYVTY